MGYKHRRVYKQEEINLMRRVKPGVYETRDGRFAAWLAGTDKWFLYDGTTDRQYVVKNKREAIERLLDITHSRAPLPDPIVATERPAELVRRAVPVEDASGKARQLLPIVDPPPAPEAPCAEPSGPKPLPRIASVLLVEVDGIQEVLGWDVEGGVRRLWSASPAWRLNQ